MLLLLSPPPLADIQGLTWSKLARGCMLGVKRGEGPALCFMGFRDKDLEGLKEITNTPIKVRREGRGRERECRVGRGEAAAVCERCRPAVDLLARLPWQVLWS